MERIIPVSNKKSIVLLLGSLVFVVGGAWMTASGSGSSDRLLDDPAVRKSVGIAAIVFFGACVLFIASRVFGKKKSFLRIDREGIYDHVSATGIGHVKWKDMQSVEITSYATQQFVMVRLRNPEEYIARASNMLLRKSFEYNLKRLGSPVVIPTGMMAVSPEELKSHIQDGLDEYKRRLVASHAYPAMPSMA